VKVRIARHDPCDALTVSVIFLMGTRYRFLAPRAVYRSSATLQIVRGSMRVRAGRTQRLSDL
jgi:hypothetical protein